MKDGSPAGTQIPPRRVSRADRSAQTRDALLDAARRVFVRAGYHGTSVDAVAAEAGYTIGAVYSRFDGKAGLFLALLERRIDERIEQIAAVADRAAPVDDSVAISRQWGKVLRTDMDWTLLVIEFRVHAARHPDLAARFAALHDRLVQALTDALSKASGPDGPARERVERFARVALSMGPGAALARAAEGEAFGDELMEAATEAVAARLLGPGGGHDGRHDRLGPR